MKTNLYLKSALIAAALLIAAPAMAYVMSSTSYRIERDSVNLGGGLGTSTSYNLESTIGEAGSGYSSSTTYVASAGYQQMDTAGYITLTLPSSSALSPELNSLVGGQASAAATMTVITTNSTGYSLAIKASTTPAMQAASASIADYTTAGAVPDYAWQVSSTAAEFGFSAASVDSVDRYRHNGSACNQSAGAVTVGTCWDALSTSYRLISQSAANNEPSGATTTVSLQAEIGSQAMTAPGSYSAAIIVTAYTN